MKRSHSCRVFTVFSCTHIPAVFSHLIYLAGLIAAQICLPVGRSPSFSLGAWALQRAIRELFGIYEVLTTPQGGLSGSYIALDLPRPRMQLSPKHSDSQMVQALVAQSLHFFNYHSSRGRTIAQLSPLSGTANTGATEGWAVPESRRWRRGCSHSPSENIKDVSAVSINRGPRGSLCSDLWLKEAINHLV